MRWIKRGPIFEPNNDYPWMVSHAALPVVDHIEGNQYRVYFSPRDSKNRAHIGFLDLDMTSPSQPLRVSAEPVLCPGSLGTFDDHGATVSHLINYRGDKYLYYTGWSLGVTIPFYFFVGLAVSHDGGRSFTRVSEAPILERSAIDPYLTASPAILIEGGVWRMWYISCTGWTMENNKPKHFYHVKYAESLDGIVWKRAGLVCIDFASKDEYALARPCVLKDGELYRMWYAYRGDRYRIGYAESQDGFKWERKDAQVGIEPSASGWDSDMIEYPYVFDHQDQRYMLYNGNVYGKTGIGYAVLEA